jgi:hypothetical protein
MLAEIEDFIEGFNQPTYRGMRINPEMGGQAIRGLMQNGSINHASGLTHARQHPTCTPLHPRRVCGFQRAYGRNPQLLA